MSQASGSGSGASTRSKLNSNSNPSSPPKSRHSFTVRFSGMEVEVPLKIFRRIPYLTQLRTASLDPDQKVFELNVEQLDLVDPRALKRILECTVSGELLITPIVNSDYCASGCNWMEILKAAELLGLRDHFSIIPLYLKSKEIFTKKKVMKQILEQIEAKIPDIYESSEFKKLTLKQLQTLREDFVAKKICTINQANGHYENWVDNNSYGNPEGRLRRQDISASNSNAPRQYQFSPSTTTLGIPPPAKRQRIYMAPGPSSIHICEIIKIDTERPHEHVMSPWTIQTLDIKGKTWKGINRRNWEFELANTARELELGDIWHVIADNAETDGRIDGLDIKAMISILSPHITKLTLTTLPAWSDFLDPGAKLIEFISQFVNLRELHVTYGSQVTKANLAVIPLDQLEIFFQGIGPKITLTVHDAYTQVLTKLESCSKNINFILDLSKNSTDFKPTSKLFQELVNKFPEMSMKFLMAFKDVASRFEFQEITEFCVQRKSLIEGLALEIRVPDSSLNEETIPIIRNCLIELCTIIRELSVAVLDLKEDLLGHFSRQKRQLKMSMLNSPGFVYPKLVKLMIYDYNYPLELLKTFCPKLEYLELNVDQGCCFFHKDDSTREDEIEDYFGNLPNLKELVIHENQFDQNLDYINESNEVESYLKDVLGPDVEIKYIPHPLDDESSESEPSESTV